MFLCQLFICDALKVDYALKMFVTNIQISLFLIFCEKCNQGNFCDNFTNSEETVFSFKDVLLDQLMNYRNKLSQC